MKNIVVLISGSGSNLQAIIDNCNTKYINAEITCVISNNPGAYGLERATSANINSIVINNKDYKSRSCFDSELIKVLDDLNPDLIVLAGFMRILTEKLTSKFFGKIVNIHPSLLPKYPGLNTHQEVINNKDKIHGVSIHYVSSKLDCGPLIAQGEIKTKAYENINHLIKRIHKIEHIIYPEVIKYICDDRISIESNQVKFNNINTINSIIYNKYEV
ncbi:phosphoribosylglycinamide formyltransferase [Gammaproteobacteria bacterium]|nr:phosphoribosylglycinamide formyltransferase [Gammaproteobacteria bacterium]|tara:strand:- start:1243 stop:1890 length:648 start_codon:yes stop_codon:yes gene_type:complete